MRNTSLLRKNRFAQRNASKFAMFMLKENQVVFKPIFGLPKKSAYYPALGC